jgi:hypothetical protein
VNPVHGIVRFLLELTAIVTFAIWGYAQSETWTRILLAILLPLLFALLWGVFAVRDDPSRSGKTVVRTPGIVRLLLELGLFGYATWMLVDLDHPLLAGILCGAVLMHYFISRERVRWLLKQK